MSWITLVEFSMINQICIPGINPIWSWHTILFTHGWYSTCDYFVDDVASMFIKDISLYFLYIFLSLFNFNLYVSLYLRWISCRQHVGGSGFLMHSDSLGLLIGILFYRGSWYSWRNSYHICYFFSLLPSIVSYHSFSALGCLSGVFCTL